MKKKISTVIVIVLMCIGGGLFPVEASEPGVSENDKLKSLFEREWQARIDRDPALASQMRQKGKDHLLLDVSPVAYQAWAKQTEQFLKKLKEIDFKQLTHENQINYQIFESQLKRRISEIEFKSYEIPFLSDSGFHTSILRLDQLVEFREQKDFQNYLKRLSAIPRFFEQNKENMKAGISRGFSMPKIVMHGFTDVLRNAYEKPYDKSSFYLPFKKMPAHLSQEMQDSLKSSAKLVINNEVFPALKSMAEFFDNYYIPQTRETLAAHALPNGQSYYQAQINHYTTLSLNAEDIHEIGLAEVKRIRKEMEEVIKLSGHQGSFKSFLSFLRESPQFYAKTAEDLIKEASYIAKRMDGELPKLFTRLPRQPYTVKPVPAEIAPKYTTGRYSGAPIDSDRAGEYWVNTYALDKRPLYVLEALTLHEAVPGHHLQTALNRELTDVPEFRRGSYISAFGEGWGLYSERLGLEVGFYKDHYSNFGRLTYEMWRAARLVIDTGIHAKGWSREQAIKLLEENSALSTHNIRTEVDRYISWPGQALSYKLGEIKIRELRAFAEKSLGNKFDLRRFHDSVLENGSIPLSILENKIIEFVEREKINK
ncbi:DUF885 family protein [Aliikangiella sp. G2MR2-5]|uniref:DUF885 domain-containing protein n=1 Tax=Aliikangiella sp. G2MR2-5 TaxID=2788943 RepID=UPI001FEEC357|nr:DUF885 domain-containing protein [Aliikangiella sp. G2MR2-5]